MMEFGRQEPVSVREMFARYVSARRNLGASPLRVRLTPMKLMKALPPPPSKTVNGLLLLPPPPKTDERSKLESVIFDYRHAVAAKPWRRRSLIIAELLSQEFKVALSDLLGDSRIAHICRTRQFAMALTIRLAGYDIADAGRHFNRDHTTAIHALQKLKPIIDAAMSAAWVQ